MKKYLLFVVFVVLNNSLYSQTDVRKIGGLKELKIGERMPNIPLGTITNNKSGYKTFFDLKGKIVILDFWFTGCTSCIESFAKMEKLQKLFGSKVQIFLVNPWENQRQIDKKFNSPGYKGPRMPELPSIVDAKHLAVIFPLNSVPHHVWIDQKGVIRLRGTQLSTYAEKISDLLGNKEIVAINDDNSSRPFDPTTPYFKIISQTDIPIQTGSFLTGFNNNYSASNGGVTENYEDTLNKSLRSTFINWEVLELYRHAYDSILRNNILKTVYSTNKKYNAAWLDYFILSVKDTLKYTSRFEFMRGKLSLTDVQYIRSRFCYEQVLPALCSVQERTEYMLNCLNGYFGNYFGLKVVSETRKQPCYVLKRTSVIDKLKPAEPHSMQLTDTIKINGKQLIRYNSTTLKDLLWELMANQNNADFFPESINSALFVFDETGIEKNIIIDLPHISEIKTLNDLRNALKVYDLDIVSTEREVEFIVFYEKDNSFH